ncbi:MAG: hypothetical protein J5992_06740 [Oscillospiraceae bacterium]|nr:hypothetical protein [Oscillospiraceae bacterium]
MLEKMKNFEKQREKMKFLLKNALAAYGNGDTGISKEDFITDFLLSQNDVVVLPCSVDSTAYVIEDGEIIKMNVITIEILGDGEFLITCRSDDYDQYEEIFSFYDVGNTLFFNIGEAENAAKTRETCCKNCIHSVVCDEKRKNNHTVSKSVCKHFDFQKD